MVVDSRFLITISKPGAAMAANSTAAAVTGGRSQSPSQRSRKQSNPPNPAKTPPCHRSRGAAAEAVVLVAVLFAFGFLAMPYLQLFFRGLAGVGAAVLSSARTQLEQVHPFAYFFMGLGFLIFAVAVMVMFHCGARRRKCQNPSCRGLRKAAEFDIEIETGDTTKNSSSGSSRGGDGLLRGFFELNAEYHRELEAELKKLAPPNGRAVLIFRGSCGCSVGRMVVSGRKKVRKVKK